MKNKIINGKPKVVRVIGVDVEEYFSYTYFPVKTINSTEIVLEPRLNIFRQMIGAACCDFISIKGLEEFFNSYVYITAKHKYQRSGKGFNRQGWHTDGFGTKDINYIWCNKQPTVFNSGVYEVSNDDKKSMADFDLLVDENLNYNLGINKLIRLDDSVLHKVGEIEEGNRCFVKISISRDKYDLKGNSINYNLALGWDYRDRCKERNVPQLIGQK